MMKYKYYLLLILLISGKAFGQKDSLLFQYDSLTIYSSAAIFNGDTIYDAKADLAQLIKEEITTDCIVNYEFYYNPLSLIGKYYCYETGGSGVVACGPPTNTISVISLNLNTGKHVELTEIFEEESVLYALKNDSLVLNLAHDSNTDISNIISPDEFISTLNQLSTIQFSTSSFAIYKYFKNENNVLVRLVGLNYVGFDHFEYQQLELLLVPKEEFKVELQNNLSFLLGQFENGLKSNSN